MNKVGILLKLWFKFKDDRRILDQMSWKTSALYNSLLNKDSAHIHKETDDHRIDYSRILLSMCGIEDLAAK